LEKAEIDSKLQDAMERTESQETELRAAKTREESTDLEEAEIESKLQDAMENLNRSRRNSVSLLTLATTEFTELLVMRVQLNEDNAKVHEL
jgi:hypothetical protein